MGVFGPSSVIDLKQKERFSDHFVKWFCICNVLKMNCMYMWVWGKLDNYKWCEECDRNVMKYMVFFGSCHIEVELFLGHVLLNEAIEDMKGMTMLC